MGKIQIDVITGRKTQVRGPWTSRMVSCLHDACASHGVPERVICAGTERKAHPE